MHATKPLSLNQQQKKTAVNTMRPIVIIIVASNEIEFLAVSLIQCHPDDSHQ